MIVIAIIGILAAIALPAYARYMARSKYSEVINAVNGVKTQVELCIVNTAPAFAANAEIIAADCDNGSTGPGYNIRAAADYATKYVNDIVVENGTITATAIATDGLNGATYILIPSFTAANTGAIDWLKGTGTAGTGTSATAVSTCIASDLC